MKDFNCLFFNQTDVDRKATAVVLTDCDHGIFVNNLVTGNLPLIAGVNSTAIMFYDGGGDGWQSSDRAGGRRRRQEPATAGAAGSVAPG